MSLKLANAFLAGRTIPHLTPGRKVPCASAIVPLNYVTWTRVDLRIVDYRYRCSSAMLFPLQAFYIDWSSTSTVKLTAPIWT